SPISLQYPPAVTPFAVSSSNSTEVSNDPSLRANETKGPRTVGVMSELNDSRAIIVSDSGPFSSVYDFGLPNIGVNEHVFVKSMMDWVTQSDPNTAIVFDNAHYKDPVANANVQSSTSVSLPIGRLFASALSYWISATNGVYSGFLQATAPFSILIVLL